VPVLVQHPEHDAEDLEDEEGRSHLLEQQAPEGPLRDAEVVAAELRQRELGVRGPREP
jgi:hypothetical protein